MGYEYNPLDPKQLSNYFDPYNKSHVKAYAELHKKGVWPKWWISRLTENGIIFDSQWHLMLRHKMAEAWVKDMLMEPVDEDV